MMNVDNVGFSSLSRQRRLVAYTQELVEYVVRVSSSSVTTPTSSSASSSSSSSLPSTSSCLRVVMSVVDASLDDDNWTMLALDVLEAPSVADVQVSHKVT